MHSIIMAAGILAGLLVMFVAMSTDEPEEGFFNNEDEQEDEDL